MLEDTAKAGQDSQMALNALEGIAYDLGEMDADERQELIRALERIAEEEPDQAGWTRSIPGALGLVGPT